MADTQVTPSAGALVLTGVAPGVIGEPVGKILRETGTDYYLLEDSSGVYLLEGIPAGTVTPGAPVLSLTGLAPRLDLSIPVSVGTLTLAGIAPTVMVSVTVSPAALVLTLTGIAPTVINSSDHVVSPKDAPPLRDFSFRRYPRPIFVSRVVVPIPARLTLVASAPLTLASVRGSLAEEEWLLGLRDLIEV